MAKRKVTMVLTGSDRVNRMLERLSNRQAKEAIRKAARPALQPTLRAARANAPRRTGRLRQSIKIRAIKRTRKKVGARVRTSKFENQFTGRTFYGAFQEWGWKTGKRQSKVAAAESAAFAAGVDAATIRGKRKKDRRRTAASLSEKLRPSPVRRQVAAKEFMRRAAISTRREATRLYVQGIVAYIRTAVKSK